MTTSPTTIPTFVANEGVRNAATGAENALVDAETFARAKAHVAAMAIVSADPTAALAALSPALDNTAVEGQCTDCRDTGITGQTERACSCAAGDAYRAVQTEKAR